MSNSGTTQNKDFRMPEVIGPIDPAIEAKAREKIVAARIALLIKAPFFGNLALRMKLICADEWLPTLATDGRHLYFNSRFVMMLDSQAGTRGNNELVFGIAHEILHCCYETIPRVGKRNKQLYNVASDYAINLDLTDQRVGTKITTIEILHDEKWRGMSSEEIYDKLLQELTGAGGAEGEKRLQEKIDQARAQKFDDLADKVLDYHMGDGEGDDEGDSDGSGKKGPIGMSDEERRQARDEFREAMVSAAQQVGAGAVPGGIKRLIDQLTDPQMDWRELLRAQLESTFKDDYSWMRVSRRGWHMDAVLPGNGFAQQINIAVALDTSGSISQQMIRDFLSEVQGIMDQFQAYRIHVVAFDSEVHNPQDFSSENLEDITEYDVQGGGGTIFESVFDHLRENDIQPERLVFFTDGWPCGSWGDPNYCDTLFVVHGNPNARSPFGTTVHYAERKD